MIAERDAVRHYAQLQGEADRMSTAAAQSKYQQSVATRIGYAHGFTGGQLTIIQEIITPSVFAVFATVVLKEPLTRR